MPLGLAILFPILVVVLIVFMFTRQSTSSGLFLMPGGAPPAIRYARKMHEASDRIADSFLQEDQ